MLDGPNRLVQSDWRQTNGQEAIFICVDLLESPCLYSLEDKADVSEELPVAHHSLQLVGDSTTDLEGHGGIGPGGVCQVVGGSVRAKHWKVVVTRLTSLIEAHLLLTVGHLTRMCIH